MFRSAGEVGAAQFLVARLAAAAGGIPVASVDIFGVDDPVNPQLFIQDGVPVKGVDLAQAACELIWSLARDLAAQTGSELHEVVSAIGGFVLDQAVDIPGSPYCLKALPRPVADQ